LKYTVAAYIIKYYFRGGYGLRKVGIESVEPEMKLTKPVLNEAGMTLFGEGTILTEKFIRKLQSMDIAVVYVEGASTPERPLEEELSLLNARFRIIEDEPFMSSIKTILKEHIESLYI
jgi:hypothetical protein